MQAVGVMIAVGIISFSMFRFAGDPVNQMVAIDTSAAQRAEIRQSLGLDDPVVLQFARYFAKVLKPGGYKTSFYLLGWTPASSDSHNVLHDIMGCRDDPKDATRGEALFVANCQKCHNPDVGVRNDCVECHNYHDRLHTREIHKNFTIDKTLSK